MDPPRGGSSNKRSTRKSAPGASRQRQPEVAEPAEKIQHLFIALEFQQPDRLADHLLIDGAVDLHEIRRSEADFHVEFGKMVIKFLRFIRPERHDGIRTMRLKVDLNIVPLAKIAQEFLVVLHQREEIPEHQRGGSIARRYFNLGNTMGAGKTADQGA